MTKYNAHKRQTSMTMAGFKPTIPVGERPHTYPLDRTGRITILYILSLSFL